MNDEFVKELVKEMFAPHVRDMNVLEWTFERGTLFIKAEDMEDGMIGIYTIELNWKGYAESPDKGNFFVS